MNTKLTSSGSQSLPFAWELSHRARGSLAQPPLVVGDRLVCASSSKLFALDLYTGAEVTADDGFPHSFVPSFDPTPRLTHSRGLVYFVNDNKLHAVQLSDG